MEYSRYICSIFFSFYFSSPPSSCSCDESVDSLNTRFKYRGSFTCQRVPHAIFFFKTNELRSRWKRKKFYSPFSATHASPRHGYTSTTDNIGTKKFFSLKWTESFFISLNIHSLMIVLVDLNLIGSCLLRFMLHRTWSRPFSSIYYSLLFIRSSYFLVFLFVYSSFFFSFHRRVKVNVWLCSRASIKAPSYSILISFNFFKKIDEFKFFLLKIWFESLNLKN